MKSYITVINAMEDYSLDNSIFIKSFIKKEIDLENIQGIFYYSGAVNLIAKKATFRKNQNESHKKLLDLCEKKRVPIFACINSLSNRNLSKLNYPTALVSGLGTLIEGIIKADINITITEQSIDYFHNKNSPLKTKNFIFSQLNKTYSLNSSQFFIKEIADFITTVLIFEQKAIILFREESLKNQKLLNLIPKELLQHDKLEIYYLSKKNIETETNLKNYSVNPRDKNGIKKILMSADLEIKF